MRKFSLQRLISFPSKSEEECTGIWQKVHISLILIEENSYYSSKESTEYIKDITKIENITKNCRRHEGRQSTSRILRNHHHSSLQKNLWCNNVASSMEAVGAGDLAAEDGTTSTSAVFSSCTSSSSS
jgi:hypothetical protein